jgi:hypothetical protein
MRGHAELAAAFALAGFYLYPSNFPETSCIALMQAQAAGAVPVTSRYAHSALPETAGLYDLGPSPLPAASEKGAEAGAGGGGPVLTHVPKEWLVKWANRVCYVAGAFGAQAADEVVHSVRTARGAPAVPKVGLVEHREEMIGWARRSLAWDGVASSWLPWLNGSLP